MERTLAQSPRSHPFLITALVLFGTAACSVLPPREYPPHRDARIEVLYEIPAGPPRHLTIPASSRELTVYSLETWPDTLEESFAGGARRLLSPPGPARVRLRCRLRLFGTPTSEGTAFRTLEELFPGARSIRSLDRAPDA